MRRSALRVLMMRKVMMMSTKFVSFEKFVLFLLLYCWCFSFSCVLWNGKSTGLL
jgi:hypothetical protein